MATLVLTVASAAIKASPLIQAGINVIAASAGAYIDSRFTIPAIMGGPDGQDVIGPRLEDLHLQNANEGAMIPFVLGDGVRVAGTIIWLSPLMEAKHTETESAGGKGGGGASVSQTEYRYHYHAAIAVCEGPISAFKRIWADTKLIYDRDGRTYTGTDISIEDLADSENPYTPDDRMKIESTSENFARFKMGDSITVSGATNAGNNGTFTIHKVKRQSNGVWKIVCVNASAVTESAGASITLLQEEAAFTNKFKDITFYTGTESQTADPLIESSEGSGNVPGFRGVAYVVIEKIKLRHFGQRLPQFTFEVEQSSSLTLASGVEKLLERGGLTSSEWDTSDLTGSLDGYVLQNLQSPAASVQPLLIAYDLMVQEKDGKLHFRRRTNPETVTIDADDLGSREAGSDPVDPIRFASVSEQALPKKVTVEHYDSDFDFQKGAARALRINATSEVARRISLPLVLSADDADALAKRLLWQEIAEWRRVEFPIPPRYLSLLEGDVAQIPYEGETYKVRVLRVEQGANFQLLVSGVVEEIETASLTGDADTLSAITHALTVPPDIDAFILNLPPLRETDAAYTNLGYYVGLARSDTGNPWRGAMLMQSPEEEGEYVVAAVHTLEAVVGKTTTVLGAGVAHQWDTENSVTVEFRTDPGLSSISELEALAGKNAFLVGDEILVARTITLVSGTTYTLSNLLRGRRNTEDAMSGHATAETVILLSSDSVTFRTMNSSMIGAKRWFLGVADDGEFDVEEATEHTIEGATLKPFAPCHITYRRRWGSGNKKLELDWIRRTRAIIRPFSGAKASLLEEKELYRVEIWSGSTKKREIEVEGKTKCNYPKSDLEKDGFTWPAVGQVKVRIYQVSPVSGDSESYVERTV